MAAPSARSAPTFRSDKPFGAGQSMTTLGYRAASVTRLAKQVTELLPPAPPSELGFRYPEVDEEWRQLVLETAELLAASVSADLAALRHAVGPPLQVGVNPPWRILLELAVAVADDAAESSVHDLLVRALRGRVVSASTGHAMAAST